MRRFAPILLIFCWASTALAQQPCPLDPNLTDAINAQMAPWWGRHGPDDFAPNEIDAKQTELDKIKAWVPTITDPCQRVEYLTWAVRAQLRLVQRKASIAAPSMPAPPAVRSIKIPTIKLPSPPQ